MSKKAETDYKEKLIVKLKKIPKSYWEKISQVATRGTADYHGCVNSFMIALELKTDEKAPSTVLQHHKLRRVEKAGGYAAMIYPENEAEILADLQRLSEIEHRIPASFYTRKNESKIKYPV